MQRDFERMEDDLIQIVGLDTLRTLYDPLEDHPHGDELKRAGRSVRAIIVSDDNVTSPDDAPFECVCVPNNLLDVKGEMTVCGDRLVLFSYTDGIIAVEIQSKTIADTARATLEMAWKHAKQWEETSK